MEANKENISEAKIISETTNNTPEPNSVQAVFAGQGETSDEGFQMVSSSEDNTESNTGAPKDPHDVDEDLDALRKDAAADKPKEGEKSADPKTSVMQSILNPEMLISGGDMALSRIGAWITKTDKSKWKLDEDEKAEILPMLTECIKEENWQGIPAKYLLVGAVAIIYGTKYASITAEKAEQEAQDKKIRSMELLMAEMKEQMQRMLANGTEGSNTPNTATKSNVRDFVNPSASQPDLFPKDEMNEIKQARTRAILAIRRRLTHEEGYVWDENEYAALNLTKTDKEFLFRDIKGYTKYGVKIGRPEGAKDSQKRATDGYKKENKKG